MISRNTDIANELQEIIPGAEWPGLTPTMGEVPAGYFEQLPALIMQKIAVQDELEGISTLLAEAPKAFPLSAPTGYFEQLSSQIIQKIAVQEEMENLSPLLFDINKSPSFSVPAGYFEQLSAQVLQKISVQEELESISPLLADIDKTPSFSIPAGYFEQLSTQVLQKISVQEELESISPLLAEIPKAFPLSVPAGYFDQLTGNVLAAVKPTKVIPMRRYLKWAIAACLLATISAGTLFFMQNKPVETERVPVGNDNSLADVSDQEIVDYLQTHMDAFDKEELLSLASLNTETLTAPLPETSEMSEEAIQNYLDNTGLSKESSTKN
jgi:adenylate kinase